MNIKTLHQLFLKYNSICTDSRTIKENDLFFALKGDTFNGNTFAQRALDKGAKYAVIDDESYAINTNFILVDKEGYIRGVYNGTIEIDVKRLMRHIDILKEEG